MIQRFSSGVVRLKLRTAAIASATGRSPYSSATVFRGSETTLTPSLTIYGHYVSQPARSVLWLLTMKKEPFTFIKIDPSTGKTRAPEFKSKFPTERVPALQDGDFLMAEGPAMMQYLCEKNNWSDFWPTDMSDSQTIKKRAKIQEYLSHHHNGARRMSIDIFRNFLTAYFGARGPMNPWTTEQQQKYAEKALQIAKEFESTFLQKSPFINGFDHPTIADILAYNEISQIEHLKIASFKDMPVLSAWLARMRALPEHDNVHKTLFKLSEMADAIKAKELQQK